MNEQTELQRREVLRLSNEESNRLTRECIQTALIKLMKDKPFDKITITELVKRSGVSRMAFYRNFTSKQNVLEEISNTLYDYCLEILKNHSADSDKTLLYEEFFRLVIEYKEYFDILEHAGLPMSAYMDINDVVSVRYQDTPPEIRYPALCWWGSLQAVIGEWYRDGMKEDIKQMAKICYQILPAIPI